MNIPNRDELLTLVRRIRSGKGSEDEISEALRRLSALLPHAPWSDLIFWPTGYPHNPATPEASPEQIVERAMTYKPFVILAPPQT